MKAQRQLDDFFASCEESSLALLVDIVSKAKGSLRKIFNFKGVSHDDLVGRLMIRVNDFSYQDDDIVFSRLVAKAKFCEATFKESDKHMCLLGAILSTPESVACHVLESIDVDCEKMLTDIANEFEFEKDIFYFNSKEEFSMSDTTRAKKKKVSIAADYGVDLTERYKTEAPKAFVSREKYISQLTRMLGRMNKNSVLVLGGSGVGKTALINELAYRIATGKIGGSLAEMSIFELKFEESDDLPKKYSEMSDFVSRIMGLFDDLSKVVFSLIGKKWFCLALTAISLQPSIF